MPSKVAVGFDLGRDPFCCLTIKDESFSAAKKYFLLLRIVNRSKLKKCLEKAAEGV